VTVSLRELIASATELSSNRLSCLRGVKGL
jgi:hypothetical protein